MQCTICELKMEDYKTIELCFQFALFKKGLGVP